MGRLVVDHRNLLHPRAWDIAGGRVWSVQAMDEWLREEHASVSQAWAELPAVWWVDLMMTGRREEH